jgi:hypothetical protein
VGIVLFPPRNMWTICGEFVVLVCILLVGNDDDKDWGELCVVDQFGVTEVSENPTFRALGRTSHNMRITALASPTKGPAGSHQHRLGCKM